MYWLSRGGEAVESALAVFERTLRHQAQLQAVALKDIANRLQTLLILSKEPLGIWRDALADARNGTPLLR